MNHPVSMAVLHVGDDELELLIGVDKLQSWESVTFLVKCCINFARHDAHDAHVNVRVQLGGRPHLFSDVLRAREREKSIFNTTCQDYNCIDYGYCLRNNYTVTIWTLT